MLRELFRRSKIEPETKSGSLSDDSLLSLFGIQTNSSGVPAGQEGAMRCSASKSATRLISETVAGLSVHLYQKQADGSRERAKDHPAEKLVSGFSNPWTSSADLRRVMTARAILDGRSYARVIRAGGNPREFQLIPFDAVMKTEDDTTGEPSYKLNYANGKTETLSYRDVLEISPLGGRSITKDASEAIGLALSLEKHGANLFANGAKPAGILKVAGKLSAEAAGRIRESWQSTFGGSNSGRTAVLEEGTSFEPTSQSSTDSQHIENRSFQIAEIARHFGVPQTLIGSLERATWSNIIETNRQFLQFGLSPWLTAWQDALAMVLLSPEERKTYFFEFETAGLVRADIAARFEAYGKASNTSWLTANEVRKRENLPPVDGGDALLQPLNHTPTGEKPNE